MTSYKILKPDNEERYPDGYCVVKSEWSAKTDRAEHYMAQGMNKSTAKLLVDELNARDGAKAWKA